MSETMMQEVPAAVDPAPLFQVASGFMAAKHLFAASELGLFAALADGPATVHEIAQRTGLSRRAARISADAMVALGLVERDGGGHRNGAIAAAYLAGTGPADLRPFLRFWDRLSYVSWTRLADALRTGVAHGSFDLSPEDGEVFAAGVEAITAGSAHALADSGLLDDRRRLLDVGGGTGSFAVAALARHPAMSATVVEVEPVASVARARLGDRAEVVTADALADPLPAGHDAILVANLAHLFSPAHNVELLRRLRAIAAPDARLLLVDFWTDTEHTDPPFAALMAGEFALFSHEGDVYSEDEVREWLTATGWQFRERRPLAGPQTLIVAT
jgi:O-methyltransferase domain/Dimerisation domain